MTEGNLLYPVSGAIHMNLKSEAAPCAPGMNLSGLSRGIHRKSQYLTIRSIDQLFRSSGSCERRRT